MSHQTQLGGEKKKQLMHITFKNKQRHLDRTKKNREPRCMGAN